MNFKMKKGSKFHGAVPPLVTPFTEQGVLDEAALDRLVDQQIAGGVAGIFVLGTTGEGAHVTPQVRRQLVARAVARAKKRVLVYAGLGDVRSADMSEANEFFRAGADAVVVHPPISEKRTADELLGWYQSLLDQAQGPLMLYNMPSTTGVSIPLDAVEKLLGHPRLAGIKDSEKNPERHAELLKRFGGREDFSVFIGVGALMAQGLRLGADGVVPSVGNLIPEVCRELCDAAGRADWTAVETASARMNAVSALYQKGRNLNESLAALKAAMFCRGGCTPQVLPPLRRVSEKELGKIRQQMMELHLLNGKT
jgi:4-hydroxy-tetrahydrodipicolinate synthase